MIPRSVINTCKLAKTWRRALVVFKAMRELGFPANTASLDLLCDACATANADDAPDVYTALRAHDVPEFVAYTASMRVRRTSRCCVGVVCVLLSS